MPQIPVVSLVPPTQHPAIPDELKLTCLAQPGSLDPCSLYPVLSYVGLTYWAWSFYDNRVAMAICAYDSGGKLVRRLDRDGARYIWQITVDEQAQTVSFAGQDDAKITLGWRELETPPLAGTAPTESHPAIPDGLKTACLADPGSLQPCSTYPVLFWNQLTYWPYSFIDNREALAICAYDPAGNLVKRVDRDGARYIYQINVDEQAQTVSFVGQAGASISVSFNDLHE